ncbi:MAG: diacylglycerol/polyprenol kinase family protein [Leptolyngbyaceae cyanobacterium]
MLDVVMALITLCLSLGWLLLVYWMAQRWQWPSYFSRKVIHIGTGPLFVLCWPLFNENYGQWLAAAVPLGLTLIFVTVGLGWVRLPLLVEANTRDGDRTELLKGPLHYGLAFVLCTVIFWRSSPVGILALMILCGGDGLADIIGRRWGTRKLPFSPDKSWLGSTAMFLGSVGLGLGFLSLFNQWGYFQPELRVDLMAIKVGAIALAATIVETFPIADIDNLTITITAVGLGLILF